MINSGTTFVCRMEIVHVGEVRACLGAVVSPNCFVLCSNVSLPGLYSRICAADVRVEKHKWKFALFEVLMVC